MADIAHSTTSITGGHTNATTSTAGFMSATDKTNLVNLLNYLNQDPATCPDIAVDDFEGFSAVTVTNGTSFGRLGFRAGSTNATGVSFVTTGQDANHIGVIQLARGTTATNGSAFCLAAAATVFPLVLGSGQNDTQDWIVRIPTLSDGTNTYGIRLGVGDASITVPANGAWIEYFSTNSANWRGIAMNASVQTVASGGSSVAVTAGVWTHLRRTWDGTTMTWYVDGVSIGSTTSIPTGVALTEFAHILGTVGTSDRTLLIDRYSRVRTFTARAT